MGLLDKKYRVLKPTDSYLCDKIVLAQAWKKAQSYIRSTNWYANTFELDQSTLSLSSNLECWKKELESISYNLTPLRLVPAPKSTKWEFVESILFPPVNEPKKTLGQAEAVEGLNQTWQPVKIIEEGTETKERTVPPLRPLAHVPIKEQTLFTSLMMCLANHVETMQGDTSTKLDDVHERKIVNYGNRLFCRFINEQAVFPWGNSTIYSKYFTDYQRFLERPYHFAKQAIESKVDKENIFEVHLDLKSFYDYIDREKLTERITKLIEDFDKEKSPILSYLLSSFESWSWDSNSSKLYEDVCQKDQETIPMGIPQGLVSGGFFANIYLLDFDENFADLIGSTIADKYRLVDYSRYVDDMRLVIVSETNESQSIKDELESFIDNELKELGLKLNKKKTKVEPFQLKRTGISQKLKTIQGKVSGPISNSEVDEQLGHLEGLINFADYIRVVPTNLLSTNPLALIEAPNHDVREDTLVRFAANKIHNLLKQKRSFYTQELNEKSELVPGSWDFLQERMARKFIACWTKDPSLVLLLKKGIELFPDVKIIKALISQFNFVRNRKDYRQSFVMEYCLGEVFRHSATVIHSKSKWSFPAHSNHQDFFEYLQCLAVDVLQGVGNYSEGVKEQARFLLLVRNDSLLSYEDKDDQDFNIVSKMIKGHRTIANDMNHEEFISNALIAHQLSKNNENIIRSLSNFLEKIGKKGAIKKGVKQLNKRNVTDLMTEIARESPSLFSDLIEYSNKNDFSWHKANNSICKQAGLYQKEVLVSNKSPERLYPIMGVIKHNSNPFKHENAVLLLIHECLKGFDFEKPIDLINSQIKCTNWSSIQSLASEIRLEVNIISDEFPLFEAPDWVSKEHKPLYHIGMFIRNCLTGSLDWSLGNSYSNKQGQYSGIKSGYLKRQFGMMHSPESINGEVAPMSSWLSGLLFNLLQWPGLEVFDKERMWPTNWDLTSLKKLIEARIEQQKAMFCQLSGIPGYVEKINLGWDKNKQDLDVVMVQSLLPQKSDFVEHGLQLDTEEYRVKHRRHVASVAELILHKKYSHESLNNDTSGKVDLIVWPELAVNTEDIDILKRLSDKTGAIIFTGLNFTNIPNVAGPNNVAKWIIPNKLASGRSFIERLQGKYHMMKDEVKHIKPWRPYQLFIELLHPAFENEDGFRLTGSICFDSTDIAMSADLKNKSNAYLIPALNMDVSTFDSMVDALFYHMYQHVVLVNTGEFGGSVAKAPYKERHEKLITHVHGAQQVSISSFKMNMFDFRNGGASFKSGKKVKTKPAGL